MIDPTIVAAVITGISAIAAAGVGHRRRQDASAREPRRPPKPPMVVSGAPAPTRPPAARPPVPGDTPMSGSGKVGPDRRDLSKVDTERLYQGLTGNELDAAFLADVELQFRPGDGFTFRDVKDG